MQRKSNILDLCLISLMTAVMAITAQIAIPLPLGVPITLQTFAVTLAGIILGHKKGGLSALIYIFIGAIGIPVFSNFTGGYQCLIGPTGGFIVSFPLMAYIVGLGITYNARWKSALLTSIILGNMINLLCGTLWFSFLSKTSLVAGFTTCVVPFLPTTLIKIVLSWIVGLNIRKRLLKIS